MSETTKNLNAVLAAAFTDEEGVTPVSPAPAAARARRRPLNGRALKLEVFGSVPGHHMYIAKDEGARIQLMLDAGYAMVQATELQGLGAAAHNTDPGGNVRFVLGLKNSGEPMYGYLMKIPEEWWEEDQAAIEKRNQEIDDQIRQGQVGATADEGEQRYIDRSRHHYDPAAAKHFRTKPT